MRVDLDELRRQDAEDRASRDHGDGLWSWTVIRGHEGWDIRGVTDDSGMRARDAYFIASIRNTLPDLIQRIETLEEALREIVDASRDESLAAMCNWMRGRAIAALSEIDEIEV